VPATGIAVAVPCLLAAAARRRQIELTEDHDVLVAGATEVTASA
jgi:hypothetical protein